MGRDGSPRWRRSRKDRRDSDSDSSRKALEDLQMWQEQEEALPEVLPSEVLGWLLFRRSHVKRGCRFRRQRAVLFIGDKLPAQVYSDPATSWYQGAREEWAPDADGSSWWGDGGWDDTSWWNEQPESELSPEEQKEVASFFAIAEQKARNLSRGFYSYNPSSKSGPKGKGKKGKGKFSSKSKGPPPSFIRSFFVCCYGGPARAAVGDPSYSGCFICGDKNHDFRSCPKRASARSGKGTRPGHVNFVDAQVFFFGEVRGEKEGEILAIEEIPGVWTEDEVFQTSMDDPRIVPEAGYAVVDSGATETVASLPALESLMNLRAKARGYVESEVVTDVPAKRFKFGNGEYAYSSSYILLPQIVGDNAVQLGVVTMDVVGVPLLLGIKTLPRLKAVLDFDRCLAVFTAVDSGLAIELRRSRSGHLLIDLKGDWLAEGTRLSSLSSQISQSSLVEENYFGEAFVVHSVEDDHARSAPDQESPPSDEPEPPVCAVQSQPGSDSAVEIVRETRQHEPVKNATRCPEDRGLSASMNSLGAFLTLVSLHGLSELSTGVQHRLEGPDPRDPRCKGPCVGSHDPDPPGKGSLSGSNQHAESASSG